MSAPIGRPRTTSGTHDDRLATRRAACPGRPWMRGSALGRGHVRGRRGARRPSRSAPRPRRSGDGHDLVGPHGRRACSGTTISRFTSSTPVDRERVVSGTSRLQLARDALEELVRGSTETSSMREMSTSVSYDRSLAAWVSRSGGEGSGKGSAQGIGGMRHFSWCRLAGLSAHSPDGGSPGRDHLDSGRSPAETKEQRATCRIPTPSSPAWGSTPRRCATVTSSPAHRSTGCRSPICVRDPRGGRRRHRPRHAAFEAWREVPAPRRGELVRLFGEELRRRRRRSARSSPSRPARSCRRASARCRR